MMAEERESRGGAGSRHGEPERRAALRSLRRRNPLQKAAVTGAACVFALGLAGLPMRGAVAGGFSPSAKLAMADPEKANPSLPAPTADAVHLENNTNRATLTFDLSHPVDASDFVLAMPDRVVVDLSQVDFQIDPEVGIKPADDRHGGAKAKQKETAAEGLIASYRFGLFAPGKSRIVIDLSAPARVLRASAETWQDGSTHLVIELLKTDRASFEAAARQSAVAATEAAPNPAAEPRGDATKDALPVVVVDPGHGGVDSGAMIDGLVEKDIVFDFAKELADKLRATGRYKVVMTRDSDIFVPLGGRVQIARDAHASLFVSIHADTLASEASVEGATVYTMSDRASDAEAARTAEKENQSDATAGVEGKQETNGVSDILFDLTRQETRAFSHVFARTLVNYWKVAARLNKNPERAAGFRVLTAPDVPSVLLELGYLSNVTDAKSLVSPEWRDATTGKVVAAVNAFFDSRGPNTTSSDPTAADEAKSAAAATALDPAIAGTVK